LVLNNDSTKDVNLIRKADLNMGSAFFPYSRCKHLSFTCHKKLGIAAVAFHELMSLDWLVESTLSLDWKSL
jgi:hypothetical protein